MDLVSPLITFKYAIYRLMIRQKREYRFRLIKKFLIIGGAISIIGIIIGFTLNTSLFATGTVYGIPGGTKDLEVHNNFVYICDKSLTIIDATNPAQPYIYKSIDMKNPQWISYQEGYLFLQEGDGNVQIVDVRDPFNPNVINILSQAGVLDLRDDLLYSVRSPNTLQSGMFTIYNFSDPLHPFIISERSAVVDWAKDIKIQEDFGFIIGGDALLTIVNISDPLDVQIVTEYYFDGISRHAGQKLQIYKNVAFITDFTDYNNTYKCDLYAINISNPILPELIWRIDSKDIENIYVDFGMIFGTSNSEGLLIYDISDLENPRLIHNYNPMFSYIEAAELQNDYVYILGYISGINRLQIFSKESLNIIQ